MTRSILCLLLTCSSVQALAKQVLVNGYNVEGQFGFALMATQLEGTGFAGDLSSEQGRTYGGSFGRDWERGYKLRLRYSTSSADFDPPSTVSPSIIAGSRTEYSVYGASNLGPEGWQENTWLGLGYAHLQYHFDDSSPAIATKQSSRGLTLLAGHDCWWDSGWSLSTMAMLYLPHQFSEKDANSGFNPNQLGYEAEVRLRNLLREDLIAFIGVRYRVDTVGFDGTGSRGVTGATDTRTELTIPIGFNFSF